MTLLRHSLKFSHTSMLFTANIVSPHKFVFFIAYGYETAFRFSDIAVQPSKFRQIFRIYIVCGPVIGRGAFSPGVYL